MTEVLMMSYTKAMKERASDPFSILETNIDFETIENNFEAAEITM